MSDCCSPSSSVASPLWIWTCSSCASVARWWWDTIETERQRERESYQTWPEGLQYYYYIYIYITVSRTSLAFCSMADLKFFLRISSVLVQVQDLMISFAIKTAERNGNNGNMQDIFQKSLTYQSGSTDIKSLTTLIFISI